MSSEIKFMAWNKDECEMYSWDDLLNIRVGYPSSSSQFFKSVMCREGDSIELLQFTGLHDRYNNEIYDSFIVRQFSDVCLIERCVGGFHCRMIRGPHSGTIFAFSFLSTEHCEIIGNKWENPEMLGVGW